MRVIHVFPFWMVSSISDWLSPAIHDRAGCLASPTVAAMHCVFPERDPGRESGPRVSEFPGFSVVSHVVLHNGSFWVNGGTSTTRTTQVEKLDFRVMPFYAFHLHEPHAELWTPEWVRCDRRVPAAVFARADLGAIYTNFWHTIATYVAPLFWILLDNEALFTSLNRPPEIPLISSLPPQANYDAIGLYGVHPDPDLIRAHNVARGTMANLFSGIHFLGTRDDQAEPICIDRLYVRTNAEWNPYLFKKTLCCPHGRTLPDAQRDWRQYMLARFGIPPTPPWEEWRNTKTVVILWISRRLARHKHIINEAVLFDQSMLHVRRRGLKPDSRMIAFETMTEGEQAEAVASAHFIVANRGAAVTNLIYARPGTGFLYLGSHDFDAVTGQKELWFKTFFYDPRTMPRNANWENYTIKPLEYMGQFRRAFDETFPP